MKHLNVVYARNVTFWNPME